MELIDVSTHAAGFAMYAYKDDDFKDMRLLYLESKNDPCLDKIKEEAIVKYGARNLLSAFYYWANDVLQSDLWFQSHVLAVNRIFNQTNELNDGAK
ncbi:hypothetical protein DSM106972_049250 [Dulcicalothrix desertica PCC 7102]|uniref:Uncharacterized protein n=1 Tax=Dulcicalothrix desertica PCC 7102 TaxID=232991 RepID=A0A433VD22_9CYAN|nr:hypothetical protein [Dulcicalothrix desertica]RUT04011.1 hypothetical protein DSM106972_049250 [Dulcicalothrix desertica PCC 7102]TWH43584.1 hypothetical protein CAL7102_07319 [Dulcicalothrix desertica PCC 7102]